MYVFLVFYSFVAQYPSLTCKNDKYIASELPTMWLLHTITTTHIPQQKTSVRSQATSPRLWKNKTNPRNGIKNVGQKMQINVGHQKIKHSATLERTRQPAGQRWSGWSREELEKKRTRFCCRFRRLHIHTFAWLRSAGAVLTPSSEFYQSGDGQFVKCCAHSCLDKHNTCLTWPTMQSPSSDGLIVTHKRSFANDFDRRENICIHHISHMLCASTHDRERKNTDFFLKMLLQGTTNGPKCAVLLHFLHAIISAV